jgi:hypothetical protein
VNDPESNKTHDHEPLSFMRFDANQAWYFLMLSGSNLFDVFREEVAEEVYPVPSILILSFASLSA